MHLLDLHGGSLTAVRNAVLAGHPVLAWVGLALGPFLSWLTPSGRKVTVNLNEHAVTLVGAGPGYRPTSTTRSPADANAGARRSSVSAGSSSDDARLSSRSPDLRPARHGHRGLVREQFDPHLLVPSRQKHLLPTPRARPAAPQRPATIRNPLRRMRTTPAGPSKSNSSDLLPNEVPIARRERKGEHHVAHDEPPTRPEDPPGLGERKLFPGIVEMVEGVIGDHESGGLVLKRESAEIGDEWFHVVHAVSGGCSIQSLQHSLGDVDRYHFAHARKRAPGSEDQCRRQRSTT